MLPFCGYHFGDYFRHWLDMGNSLPQPPRIYSVNWFRRDESGHFMWPGFGENMRVLKWVVERCEGKAGARDTAIGRMPRYVDWSGLDMSQEPFERLTNVNPAAWREEVKDHRAHFARYKGRLPQELDTVRRELERALR
jgi:phosphoenolpyruvate carboxykinase (GTP)